MVHRVFTVIFIITGLVQTLHGQCTVTAWSAWSPCAPEGTPRGRLEIPLGAATGRSMASRAAMEDTMVVKETNAKELFHCRTNGSCPHSGLGERLTSQTCVNGNSGGYECKNIDLLAYVPMNELLKPLTADNDVNKVTANDIWGWTDLMTGVEWALIGLSTGTACVKLSNPQYPQTMAYIPSRTGTILWRDMKVVGNTMYIVSEAKHHGLQVFDLTRLRDLTEFKTLYEDHDTSLKTFGMAHNIVVNEERQEVYVVGARGETGQNQYQVCNSGLMIVDVSSPLSPTFKACYSDDGYTHDAQCVVYKGPDTRYKGHNVCFNFNEDTLTIVDVEDSYEPKMISKTSYQGYQYTHQGWLTEDHQLLLLDDELDEDRHTDKRTRTHLWDVTDLQAPTLKNTYYSQNTAIDHNQYIIGDYTYQSDYEAGLRILYIQRGSYPNLHEVAYFDVHEGNDMTTFHGSWSNYPYFKSGIVAMSSIEKGLFVVRPNMDLIEKEADEVRNTPLQGVRWRRRDYRQDPDPELCNQALEQTEGCQLGS